jgi:hypothetical protein
VQEDRPSDTPPGYISIDPDEGFGPHMSEAFLDRYGTDSVFVTATVDCLTWRFIRLLVNGGNLSSDFEPLQYGCPEMREALEALLEVLAVRGLETPFLVLMQSAAGRKPPQAFEDAATALLGAPLFADWLRLLEQENYAAAAQRLVAH